MTEDEEDLTLEYHRTAEEPSAKFWLRNSLEVLIDFSTYTFTLWIGRTRSTPIVTKTTGIVGGTGSGESPDGVPNIEVTWDTGELLDLDPGNYRWWLQCRSTVDRDRVYEGPFISKFAPTS